MPQTHFNAILTTVFVTLFLLIPAVSAEDEPSAVSWNISYNTHDVTNLTDDFHISVLSFWILFLIAVLFFILSLKWKLENGIDVLAGISMIIFGFLTITGFNVQSWSYEVVTVQLNETAQISVMPVVYTQPGWIVFITALFLVISVINLYRVCLGLLTTASDKPLR